MVKSIGSAVAIGLMVLAASVTGAAAQGCVQSIGEAAAGNRDAALRQAYEAMLRGAGEAVWRSWLASSQRIGEAPGYSVSKMTTNCSPRGGGTFCRVSAVLCRT